MFGEPTIRQPNANRFSSSRAQREEAVETLWKAHWPFITATLIGVFMLLFGLAVAGLEAAKLDVESNIDTTSVSISVSSSRTNALKIGVGIWSGAVVAVAAVFIFVINCSSHVKHWAQVSFGLVGAAAIFCITNFSINAKIVRIAVVTGGFNSSDPTAYRLAAAQIAAASLSFIACVAYLVMFAVVVLCIIWPIVKRQRLKPLP